MMKKLLLLHVEPLIVALRKILAEYRRFVASSPSRPSNKKVAILAARPVRTGATFRDPELTLRSNYSTEVE